MQTLLDVNQLSLTFGNKKILKNINISVVKPELIYIVGTNGSGKSSLFNCITGRYKPSSGEICINGSIGYHEQKPVFILDMTVEENICCFNIVFKCGLTKSQLMDLILKVNLDHCFKQNTKKLSGGEKQRLSLAITLMRQRDIYLFDEAESAMDPIGRKMFFDSLMDLKQYSKTVFWISHHIKESLAVADRGCYLSDGLIYEFDVKEYAQIASEYTEDAFARLCEERLVKNIC
ncbi:MAG: ABC transporter ATP-binding protein [Herbinix sp.]|nr:ABC transporter ATP-binding protein [Herbinix sp.]